MPIFDPSYLGDTEEMISRGTLWLWCANKLKQRMLL